jgi:hypothetical protein
MRSLRGRVKAVGTYIAERREADRFQPEGWETAEGRAILSQYRAERNGNLAPAPEHTPAAELTGEDTDPGPVPVPAPRMSRSARVIRGVARVARQLSTEITAPIPLGRGVARVAQPPSDEIAHRTNGSAQEVARHAADEVATDSNHRPRHDGTQSQVDSSYLLTGPPATRHGALDPVGSTDTARVLTITSVVRGPDGDPLTGAIVTITLIADHSAPGFQPNATIDGVARIVTAEEGACGTGSTGVAQVVPMNTRYQVVEVTRRPPNGRALMSAPALMPVPVNGCEGSG